MKKADFKDRGVPERPINFLANAVFIW